jgi:hypothetical protein
MYVQLSMLEPIMFVTIVAWGLGSIVVSYKQNQLIVCVMMVRFAVSLSMAVAVNGFDFYFSACPTSKVACPKEPN